MATTDELSGLIVDDVRAALGLGDTARTDALERIAADAYGVAAADAGAEDDPDGFVAALSDALELLEPDGTDEQAERMARIISHAAVNAATVASAPDAAYEWRTMRDDAVRELHRPLDGEVRAAGDPFDVGGQPMLYPGQPVGPPEGWINCRCTLVPAVTSSGTDPAPASELVTAGLTARAYSTEERERMADKGQALPDGSFPIADEEDLRNAIQAIGRASDPDAARAHIRKRARALGLSDLIPESWTASAVEAASPPGTHDGPGWLTNPRETQRLRTYWTKGEGALKIRWGQRGDFDRCRRQLRKYVRNPEFLDGTCANLHHVALGFWPGQGPHASVEPQTPEGVAVTAAFTAAAELDDELPPLEWFTDPHFTGPTPLTITSDGHVYGHGALFNECHLGYEDRCVTAPHSDRSYAHFRTGAVVTAGGTVSVGQITMDTGHAEEGLAHRAAVAHYDDTGTVVADVAAGEDEWGVWLNGMLRPGLSPEKVRALQAAAISGDWRRIGGQLEFVAALAVNVPGFPVPRPQLVASAAGDPWSMVAVGVVGIDPNAQEIDRIAVAVVDRIEERQSEREQRAARAQRVATLRAAINEVRVGELVAAVEGSA